jgi:HEAT repeat protein
VEWSNELAQPHEQVLSALLQALNSDPNVNVRLAAVDALEKFARFTTVQHGLVEALARQDSPLVQIEVINVIVQSQNKESIPILKTLLKNSQLDDSVRQCAERGIQELS